ncbi:MAG: dihydroorotase [Puniceicoccales bacterium]|jgi:dihydroorotase|nr:dihydroorotase [Puniceicoccales bacterium]
MNPSPLWIKNGRVIDPESGRDAPGDVFVLDGVLADCLPPRAKREAVVIDAADLVVAPGFVDLHARLGEPGNTACETIASGSRAAAAGGFTSLVAMPNNAIPADNVGVVQLVKEIAAKTSLVRVFPAGAVTIGHKGEKLAPIGSLKKAGVVAVTDGSDGLQNNEMKRRTLEYASMFDLVVFDHCQDTSMTHGAVMHEGVWSVRLGLRGFPSAAEEIVVANDLLLARLTGARLHLQHISAAGSVAFIRHAKAHGVPITAEVAADHLLLTDEALRDYDTNFKLAAPLREETDRRALAEGLRDGTIDAIVSDHSPVTPTEKDREFDLAPFGAIALETAFPVALEALYHNRDAATGGAFPLSLVVDKFTRSPARVLGLDAGSLAIGKPADITLFSPDECWTPTADGFQSRSSNSAHIGRPLRGRTHMTIVGGKIVFSAKPRV